jgi:hypothetical protein
MGIKILLKYQRGCFVINRLPTMLRQHRRSVTLIDQHSLDTETAVNLVRKTPAPHGHLMFGAIRMQRQTHDHTLRLPLGEQRRYRIELTAIGRSFDNLQRLRLPYQGITDRNPDALEAKVESQYRHHARAAAQTESRNSAPKAAIKLRRAMG